MDGSRFKKTFVFENTQKRYTIDIAEEMQGEYACYTWPAAPVLAQYMVENEHLISEKNILEIGAGTGLAGIVAAKAGGHVTLSDYPNLNMSNYNIALNQLDGHVNTVVLKWGTMSEALLQLSSKVDFILGSDCFYETKDFEDIITTVSFLLSKNPSAEFWTTYQERSANRCIDYLLVHYGLIAEEVPLKSFNADSPNVGGSNLPGNHTIRLFKMMKAPT